MTSGVGHWHGWDPALLWLWHRPAATAAIRPPAWEPPYAAGAALKRQKKEKKFVNGIFGIFSKWILKHLKSGRKLLLLPQEQSLEHPVFLILSQIFLANSSYNSKILPLCNTYNCRCGSNSFSWDRFLVTFLPWFPFLPRACSQDCRMGSFSFCFLGDISNLRGPDSYPSDR